MKRTGPSNPYLKELISNLKERSFKENSHIWSAVAEKLEKPTRKKIEVNLSDIERNSDKNDSIVVPGVVLSSGSLTKSVNVAAWRFSDAAKEKIKKSKGKIMTIDELAKENPKGTGVKILV
jgi:large subunit ribosomal protein L18e